jgi:hypothetical protein
MLLSTSYLLVYKCYEGRFDSYVLVHELEQIGTWYIKILNSTINKMLSPCDHNHQERRKVDKVEEEKESIFLVNDYTNTLKSWAFI